LYARQNRLDDALQVLRTGLQQDPKNMVLRLGVAGIQEAKHDIEGAMGTYESMLKDDPTSMLIANNLASLLSDYRSDKESLERAYSFASILAKAQVPQFKDTLGWINHLRGDNVTALQMLEEAARELPKVALVQFHLGATYQAVGQPQKATEQFKKAAELVIGQDDAVAQKIRAALKS
jgi:Tfp pilus assembly protein PilF